jgi:nitroreductase
MFRDFVKPLMQTLAAKQREGQDWFTYNAPAALLFHSSPMDDGNDRTIVTTYAMLAAESIGLGSCLLGTTAALNQSKDFKIKHGIPVENKLGLGLVLGYPAVKFQRGVRRRLASVQFA